jgi:hypothetical protein
MGEPDSQWESRVRELQPYRVTAELMASTGKPGTRFLHCLPSIHNRMTVVGTRLHEQFGLDGAEVTEEVFESPASVVFDQAENRLHTIKALIDDRGAGRLAQRREPVRRVEPGAPSGLASGHGFAVAVGLIPGLVRDV